MIYLFKQLRNQFGQLHRNTGACASKQLYFSSSAAKWSSKRRKLKHSNGDQKSSHQPRCVHAELKKAVGPKSRISANARQNKKTVCRVCWKYRSTNLTEYHQHDCFQFAPALTERSLGLAVFCAQPRLMTNAWPSQGIKGDMSGA